MSKLKYHQAFTELTTLALLHLYSYIDRTSQFVPMKKRNERLNKFLKSQMALPRNEIIKKDIKVLIAQGRKGMSLEKKLGELHKVNCEYGEKFTDADHLFVLLTYLYEAHGFESMLDDPDIEREKGIIYTDNELIDSCFSDEHVLSRPLPISIIMNEPERLVDIINGHGGIFVAEIVSIKPNDNCATILLHKVSNFKKIS
ncbi:DUF2913 family protein [Aliivibrio fischeri]|uniref:DUF2913 family protein n=1 Tax=Aliivibrio fischeri TaxID=668 RepID=UPI00080E6C62|nr:DUF2913 family protein [Aliivibrio fischeri]OCH41416.1 hypothetical protein A6E02_15430 [Aliivibrio fischeri]